MNGSIYHHACTQTPIVRTETKDTSNLRTRETQTSETRTLSVQSYREAGKIMKKVNLEFGIRNLIFEIDVFVFVIVAVNIILFSFVSINFCSPNYCVQLKKSSSLFNSFSF